MMAAQSEEFSGPLPHPRTLAEYDEALPGLAERLVTAWEEESRHRRSIELEAVGMDKKLVGNEVFLSRLGMASAFVLALVFLGAAVWLVLAGHEVAGTVLGSFDLVALASVFITRKWYDAKKKKTPEAEHERE